MKHLKKILTIGVGAVTTIAAPLIVVSCNSNDTNKSNNTDNVPNWLKNAKEMTKKEVGGSYSDIERNTERQMILSVFPKATNFHFNLLKDPNNYRARIITFTNKNNETETYLFSSKLPPFNGYLQIVKKYKKDGKVVWKLLDKNSPLKKSLDKNFS